MAPPKDQVYTYPGSSLQDALNFGYMLLDMMEKEEQDKAATSNKAPGQASGSADMSTASATPSLTANDVMAPATKSPDQVNGGVVADSNPAMQATDPAMPVPSPSSQSQITSHQMPEMEYRELVARTILAHGKPMLPSEMYTAIEARYPYFKTAKESWKNHIRQVLITEECFYQKEKAQHGNEHFWWIHDRYIECFRKGNFKKPEVKAKIQQAQSKNANRYHPYKASTSRQPHNLPSPNAILPTPNAPVIPTVSSQYRQQVQQSLPSLPRKSTSTAPQQQHQGRYYSPMPTASTPGNGQSPAPFVQQNGSHMDNGYLLHSSYPVQQFTNHGLPMSYPGYQCNLQSANQSPSLSAYQFAPQPMKDHRQYWRMNGEL